MDAGRDAPGLDGGVAGEPGINGTFTGNQPMRPALKATATTHSGSAKRTSNVRAGIFITN